MRTVRYFLAATLVLLTSAAAIAQTPQISTRVDRSSVGLGETLVMTVDIRYPGSVEVVLPPPDALKFPPFEVIDAVDIALPPAQGEKVERYTVRLAAYQDGKQTIPSFHLEYKNSDGKALGLDSTPVAIEVQRGAPAAAKVDIHDIKPMADVATPTWITAAKGAALALPILLVLYGIGRWMRRRSRPIPSTPHGLALQALDRLAAENLPGRGQLKLHYDRLAEILRTYLASRFNLPVLESTTGEVVTMMADLPQAGSLQLATILHEADLVKFAKSEPGQERAHQQIQRAREIVENTQPQTVPVLAGKEN